MWALLFGVIFSCTDLVDFLIISNNDNKNLFKTIVVIVASYLLSIFFLILCLNISVSIYFIILAFVAYKFFIFLGYLYFFKINFLYINNKTF